MELVICFKCIERVRAEKAAYSAPSLTFDAFGLLLLRSNVVELLTEGMGLAVVILPACGGLRLVNSLPPTSPAFLGSPFGAIQLPTTVLALFTSVRFISLRVRRLMKIQSVSLHPAFAVHGDPRICPR
mmetsp:Transcript_5749/g.17299  ORF Transcript_5749/g.17299 Transcript_5749/m.17299 type:complete len:128 (+) Transcript_5749:650-1033(+)